MYDITNRNDAVREIKKYLYLVSEYIYPKIGRNTIDGIYDASTAESVRKYQAEKSLSVTGKVDYETFNHLFKDYCMARAMVDATGYLLTDEGFPLSLGDMNEDVRILHAVIGELRSVFSELYDVGTGSYYSKRTAQSVKMLRDIFGFPSAEHVDEALYRRMLTEVSAHKRNARTNDLKNQNRV